jgi:beta-glucosidase
MGAIANRYGSTEAPIMAVVAGADIFLMPVNPETAIQAVCDAVRVGRIAPERIQASVERIWKAKQKVSQTQQRSHESANLESSSQYLEGVDEFKSYTPQNIFYQLAQPASLNTVTHILQESQQVGGSLPLSLEPNDGNRRLRNLIVIDDALACDFLGRNTPAVTFPRQMGYELQLVDRYTPKAWEDVNHVFATQPTLLQLFIRGNPFRGSAGLTPVAEAWFKRLLRTGDLQALVIYGSPYVLQQFLPDLTRNTPFVFSYGQMPQAQAIALEALFSSRLPVNSSTTFL